MPCYRPNDDITVNYQQQGGTLIDNQLWSVPRLAEYLDVPIMTVRDWVYKRQIPFVKVGRHIRFQPSDVQRWLSERSHGNGHPEN